MRTSPACRRQIKPQRARKDVRLTDLAAAGIKRWMRDTHSTDHGFQIAGLHWHAKDLSAQGEARVSRPRAGVGDRSSPSDVIGHACDYRGLLWARMLQDARAQERLKQL